MSDDLTWLTQAVELSRLCPPSDGAFSVGAILVDAAGQLVSSGYSREDGPALHAEEVAIGKALRAGRDLAGTTLFSSLEPCSVRLSGKKPCVEHILAAGIARVVIALREPPVFVACRGLEFLAQHGVEVLVLAQGAAQVADINRHLFQAAENENQR